MAHLNIDLLIAGAISGAIVNPESPEAIAHAELYYKEVRQMNTDVEKIARNTGFTFDQILMVKNYLFLHEHNLEGVIKLFDPCFEIAESWRRLALEPKNIKPHDITLIKHELKEIELINKGYSQMEAHDLTEKEFNYTYESDLFYSSLKADKEKKSRNSGGIYKKPMEITH